MVYSVKKQVEETLGMTNASGSGRPSKIDPKKVRKLVDKDPHQENDGDWEEAPCAPFYRL